MTLICAHERLRDVLHPVHPLDDEAVERLHAYTRVLDRWAARQRLVGWRRAEALLADGLRDAWSAVPLLKSVDAPILDVGSGAGLPALVFAAGLPERAMHLVESRRKRASFLREAVRVMGISRVEVHHGRVEELVDERRIDPTDALVTSRAFASPTDVLKLAGAWGASSCLATSSSAKIPVDAPAGWREIARTESRPHADSLHVVYRTAVRRS